MATISTPTLALGSTVADKRNVTVGGSMTFDAADVGKSYRLEIKIYGEDVSGDNLPATDSLSDDLVYTYSWTSGFFVTAYKSVTVAAAGTVNFSETRAISVDALDEDTGKVLVGMADINTPIFLPRSDEVYARVTLSGSPTTKRSSTVQAGIGV